MHGRRRRSAPAAVLQQTLQHFQDGKGTRAKFDSKGKHLPTTDMPKQYRTNEKKGKKEHDLEKFRNGSFLQTGYDERNFLSDSESYSSRPLDQDNTPSKRVRNDRIKKVRYRRKETDSAAISREFCTPFYYSAPSKNFASLQKKSGSSKDYHIVLLGQCGVGKSALLVRFTTGRFIHEYDPFLEMTYEVCVDIDEDASMLHITDTASTHEPVYLNQNEGFIVVYAVDDFRTFETAKQIVKLVREIKKQKGKYCSIALVGNKMDLRHNRVVSTRRASGFAREHECMFYEVSAAKDVNVKVIFHDTIRQLRLLQLSRKSNQGPMDSIKKIFHKIKTEDKSRPSQH